MKENLRLAAEKADEIAKNPLSGRAFDALRTHLKLAEGCCRQAAHYRGDVRWLRPGIIIEQAHQIARAWLHRPSVESKKLFTGLAAALRKILVDLKTFEKQATGRVGSIIVPDEYRNPLVQVRGAHGGLLPMGLKSA